MKFKCLRWNNIKWDMLDGTLVLTDSKYRLYLVSVLNDLSSTSANILLKWH